jgi:hypothetical protein
MKNYFYTILMMAGVCSLSMNGCASGSSADGYPGYYVKGTKMYDGNGNVFIPV